MAEATVLNGHTQLQARGVIQQVDLVSRELTVAHDALGMKFDVPVDCAILLNAQRVKLRLLQPGDPAVITYDLTDGQASARHIEVTTVRGSKG